MPGKLLFRLERKDYPVPGYKPAIWFDRGRVVLDTDNNPLKLGANLPLTLASNADPWLLETLRREDTRITLKDLRARMPSQVQDKEGNLKPLGTLSALGMQLSRFRMSVACPAWNEREGSDNIRDYVKGLLSDEGLATNSTEELTGLSTWQQAKSKKLNKGLYLERAGNRALPANERKRRDKDETKRLKELRPSWEIERRLEERMVPAKCKQNSRAPRKAPTASSERNQQLLAQPETFMKAPSHSSLGSSNPVVQAIPKKRGYADAADPEDSPSPKRRNVGVNPILTNLIVKIVPLPLPRPGHTSISSLSPRRGETQNELDGLLYEGERSNPSGSIPAPRAGVTATALLQRSIPKSISWDDTLKTGQRVIQRKRSRSVSTELEVEQELPSPKRRNVQGVVGLKRRPMQPLRTRSSRNLVPRLPHFLRALPCIREEKKIEVVFDKFLQGPWMLFTQFDNPAHTQLDPSFNDQISIHSQPGLVGAGETEIVDFNDWKPEEIVGLDIPDAKREVDYRYSGLFEI